MAHLSHRLRGFLVRAVLARRPAIIGGLLLSVPSLVLLLGRYRWQTPYTDAVALVLGATGLALLLAGIGGRRPDWIDPNSTGSSRDEGGDAA